MSRLNLTNIATVCAIARLGTFTAASERLHASQPAITARVRELERSVGITFFQRRGRRMELTVEGRHFIDRVEPLVAQIEETVLEHSEPSAANGVVRIGVGAVTMTWFPEVVETLKREMPNVHYEVDVDMGMNMIEKLESGKLDLAIVGGKVRFPGLKSHDLTGSDLQWVMSSKLPQHEGGRQLTIGELLDRGPLWFVARSSILFPRMVASARRHGARLTNVNTCASMAALLDLIDRGGGIGMVATRLAKDRIASGALLSLSDQLSPETLELTLLYHDRRPRSIVRQVAERLVEAERRRSGDQVHVHESRPRPRISAAARDLPRAASRGRPPAGRVRPA